MTGYARVDSVNNIADGNIINASDLDGEFDGVAAAFNASTGHVHDGSAANGAPITKVGPTQDVVVSATTVLPKTTATVDIGSSSLKFKDFFFSGAGSVTGTITAGGFAGPINGTVGATTAAAGAFTTLSASSTTTLSGLTASTALALDASKNVVSVTNTGTGSNVLATSPTLVTPALGTPSSGVVTNLTGTASININGTVGATTPTTGSFTSLAYSTTLTGGTGIVNLGSGQFYKDASGLVGIGTASPTVKLQVTTSGVAALPSSSGTAFSTGTLIRLGTGSDAAGGIGTIGLATNQMWIQATDSTNLATGNQLLLNPNGGNVAIGATTATQRLHVSNSAASSDAFAQFTNGTTGTAAVNGLFVGIDSSNEASVYNFYNSALKFGTNAIERMRIDSSGNLLVGTTSLPTGGGIVTASSSAAETKVSIVNTGTSGRHYWIGSTNTSSGAVGGGKLAIYDQTADATRLAIDSSGNVGIGTSSPATNFNISSASAATGGDGNQYVQTTYTGTGTVNSGYTAKNYYGTSQFFQWENIGTRLGNRIITNAGGGNLIFTYGNDTEGMRIDSGGRVGIGTSSPSQRFVVSEAGANNILMAENTAASIQLYMQATNSTGALGTLTNHALNFLTNNTERMRISSSGNVGIGTSSPVAKLHVVGADSAGTIFAQHPGNNNFGTIIQVATTGGTDDPMISLENYNAGSPVRYSISCTDSGALAFMSGGYTGSFGTERMRIDSSGNVGIGASPTYKLDVAQSSAANNFIGRFINTDTGASSGAAVLVTQGAVTGQFQAYGNAAINFGTQTNHPIVIQTNTTERMRIDTSGNVMVGTTTASAKFNVVSSADVVYFETSGSTATCSYFKVPGTTAFYALFQNSSGTNIGSIRTTDGTTVQYNTSSDYRLKDNVVPMTGALARVASLKPCTYTWKSTGQASQGFIAHELQAVVPECVSGEKDAVDADGKPIHQGVDTSFLVATLTAAIQEQQALITSLTARITALELT